MARKPGMRMGLDIGSAFVKLVILDEYEKPVLEKSLPHQGDILKTTRELTQYHIVPNQTLSLAVIGRYAGPVAGLMGIQVENELTAVLCAVRKKIGSIHQIINIGSSSLSLIQLDTTGRLLDYQTNTLCAAGTGSFLDEQAVRMGMSASDAEKLPFIADPPSMATRCAVFAKSDLIHRQQEGYPPADMWNGICKSIARTIISTLFKGKKPVGKTAVIGGVAQNPHVMHWLGQELSEYGMVYVDNPQEIGAHGAALLAKPVSKTIDWSKETQDIQAPLQATRPPLVIERSVYPTFKVEYGYTDRDGNEVRITRWPGNGQLSGFLGIDVGSTSTKLVMIDRNENVILDIYRKTGGNPLKATAKLFSALRELVERRKGSIEILGVGTTGSGRKLVGMVIKADNITNEITAHLKGAMKVDPEIDTIFEIGGQDSKYIHAVNGHLHEMNMNYVCAAGTGSFIEEVSHKTGLDLRSIGDRVVGVRAPVTSDRCTVFMGQDITRLLQQGFSPTEVMGGILYSVAQNYLNKVVGNRYCSTKKILFQGATARNKGLVAAFEALLNTRIVVSPYCHVMGSLGVAILTKQEMAQRGCPSQFTGLRFSEKDVFLTSDTCRLCTNNCNISHLRMKGSEKTQAWGSLCGRESEDIKAKTNAEFKFFRQREHIWKTIGNDPQLPEDAPVIHLPNALLSYSYYPFWQRFFAALAYRLVLSRPTSPQIIRMAANWVGADYCQPVKLAHGHIQYLLTRQHANRVFVPCSISERNITHKSSQAYFCPYNMALPGLIRSAFHMNGLDTNRLLTATIDFRWDKKTAVDRLVSDIGHTLKKSKDQISLAWEQAWETKHAFETEVNKAGQHAMTQINSDGAPAIVILGRPYNVFDAGANLSLPEKLSTLGFTVLPLEYLNLDEEDLGKEFNNMFWNEGRKILEAARIIARTPNLFAVYLSNFGCGPDSFIQTYVEEIMGDKPMLTLEMDEHGADTGYMTRLEAFADVLAANQVREVPRYVLNLPDNSPDAIRHRTLWISRMGEAHPEMIAAIFRNSGICADVLPMENNHSFLLGRSLTRGGECAPYPATIGALMAMLKDNGEDTTGGHALFMPTASGPCRFGQYCLLDRIVLNKMGYTDIPIVSWSSVDNYQYMSDNIRRKMWLGTVISDILFKMRCRIKPYERKEGQTEAMYQKHARNLAHAFENGLDIKRMMKKARDEFLDIPVKTGQKPLVGIVGEIYVRNNRFINKDLVRRIEQAGAEVWLTPICEWLQYTSHMAFLASRHQNRLSQINSFFQNRYLHQHELGWTRLVCPILDEREEPDIETTINQGSRYLSIDFKGEAIITLGRVIEFMKSGVDLVVNCTPFGCMPGNITAGIFQSIQKQYTTPVINLFFDGEHSNCDIIDTYLSNLTPGAPGKGNFRCWNSS
ncbi:MAG: acyl-CoA dehydratase activase [Desulfobacter sp.]